MSDNNTDVLETKNMWDIVEGWYNLFGTHHHQLFSYNNFMDHLAYHIPPPLEVRHEIKPDVIGQQGQMSAMMINRENFGKNILKETTEIIHRIKFVKPVIQKPKFNESDPNKKVSNDGFDGIENQKGFDVNLLNLKESRDRSIIYSGQIFIDVIHSIIQKDCNGKIIDQSDTYHPQMTPGDFPVMVRSKYCNSISPAFVNPIDLYECPYDRGGYFLIGIEKAIVVQETMANNYTIIKKKSSSGSSIEWEAEIRSLCDFYVHSPAQVKLLMKIGRGGIIKFKCKLPYLPQHHKIYLVDLFRALGVKSDKDIFLMIAGNGSGTDPKITQMIRDSIENGAITQQDGFKAIQSKLVNLPSGILFFLQKK